MNMYTINALFFIIVFSPLYSFFLATLHSIAQRVKIITRGVRSWLDKFAFWFDPACYFDLEVSSCRMSANSFRMMRPYIVVE